MKKIKILFALFGAFVIAQALQSAFGQSNTIPSFVSTAGSYFTSFNTNLLTFSNGMDRFDLSTGTENWNNAQLLAVFQGDAQVYGNFRALATFYNDTTLGSLSKADIGPGYAIVLYDTKTTLSLNNGWDWDAKAKNGSHGAGYTRPDLKFEKAMTQHTFMGVNIGVPIYWQGIGRFTPNYGFKAGFNF